MNKTKRAFQLTCAIMSIVYGSILALGCLMLFACMPMIMDMIASSGGTTVDPAVDEAMIAGLYGGIMACGLLSVPLIVIGALSCVDRSKRAEKPSENTGLMITLIVFYAILLALGIASVSVLSILISLVGLGFAIASLCIRKLETPAVETATVPNCACEQGEVQNTVAKSVSVDERNEKIAKIRELCDQGVLTQEEAKNLIIKELEK